MNRGTRPAQQGVGGGAEAAESVRPLALWYRSSSLLALAGALLLWAALPPLQWAPLAWVAPVCWMLLIRDPHLTGRRLYGWLWLAGLLHWLAVLQGIRLAHWALYFGWAALAMYLGLYLPLFVGLTRVAVHRWRVSVVLAAPVVWTGLELLRGHLITGFSAALLAHTQVHWVRLIQICDLFGAYGVTFLVILVAACLARMLPWAGSRLALWPALVAVGAVAGTLLYGTYRLAQPSHDPADPRAVKVALVQCAYNVVFEHNPRREQQTFNECRRLSIQARSQHPDLDLIIWPESTFTANLHELVVDGPELRPPPQSDLDPQQFQEIVAACISQFRNKAQQLAQLTNQPGRSDQNRRLNIHFFVGAEAHHLGGHEPRRYNSALHIDPAGEIVKRYYKQHLVMFGEYIPFGDRFPLIYRLSPMAGGLSRGKQPEVFTVAGLRMAPSICFESTVPHLIRAQIRQLTQRGKRPDILINVTNDGWFWGSSVLDLHFACGVFRAVESRRPFLVAANTGITACIDSSGRIQRQAARGEPSFVVAQLRADPRQSPYVRYGDLPAALCLLICLGLALSATRRGGRPPSPPRSGEALVPRGNIR